ESATILAIVVLGGAGSQFGVAVAAALIVGSSELLRELTFLKAIFGPDFDPTQYRMLLVGLAMVAMMNFRPRGRKFIIATMARPTSSMRYCVGSKSGPKIALRKVSSRNSSEEPTIKAAAMATPSCEPAPPSTTMARMVALSVKVKLDGETTPCLS